MAYAVDQEEQQKNQQPDDSGSNALPVATSAAPGSGPTGAKTPTGAASQQAPAQPFTNLQTYLSANAPQVKQQADTISGNLTNQYGQIQSDIDQGVQDFGSDVASGYAAPNQQVVDTAAANPTEFVKDPNNVKAFQGQLNNKYTGPSNFESTSGYAGLNDKVTKAKENADLLKSPSGISTYLQGSGGNSTAGENTLDSALLQQSPEAIQQVRAAASPFSQLSDYLSGKVSTADQVAQAAPGAAKQAADYAAGKFTGAGGVVPKFANDINTGAANAETSRNDYNKSLTDYLTQIAPLLQQAHIYGGVGGDQNLGFDTVENPYSPSNQIVNPISAANYASADQYAEAMALQQLMGGNLNLPISEDTSGQAGTAPTVPGFSPIDLKGLAQEYANALTKSTLATDPNNFKGQLPQGQTFGSEGTALRDFLQYLESVNPDSVYSTTGSIKGGPPIKTLHPKYNPI